MTDVSVIREITISNKHKKIYKEYEGYKELNEADQEFFDSIFPVLWMNDCLELSNNDIGAKFNYSKSTIQKKLKRCQAQGLIIRDQKTIHDEQTGRFSSSRKLYLDPWFKSWFASKLGLKPNIPQEEITKNTQVELEPENVDNNEKLKANKPVIKKFRR